MIPLPLFSWRAATALKFIRTGGNNGDFRRFYDVAEHQIDNYLPFNRTEDAICYAKEL